MQKEELEGIIAKYRNLAGGCDDKCYQYDRFADFMEDNIEIFEEDESFETEKDLMDYFNEVEEEVDAQWDSMFPEGDDDDSITDFLTR